MHVCITLVGEARIGDDVEMLVVAGIEEQRLVLLIPVLQRGQCTSIQGYTGRVRGHLTTADEQLVNNSKVSITFFAFMSPLSASFTF